MIFDVVPSQIEKLDSNQLVELLKKLLHAEAQRAGISLRGVSVPLQITIADGGEDARISWQGGLEQTDYLPSRFCIFQSKATKAELLGMEHKNLAVELLQKLLKDEVKHRSRTNIVQSRKLAEMLDDALRRYRNQVISVIDVLEELLELAKDTNAANARGEELKLEPYELAFYDALSQNHSAREIMGVDKLRELAIVLVERIRKNASIDWNLKESVRARMKVAVKRLLRQYGYPPDMEALATELVLEQAKVLTEYEISNS